MFHDFLIAALVLWFVFVAYYTYQRKMAKPAEIQKKVQRLSQNLDEQHVNQYVDYVGKTSIPNELAIWNALRASWKLVNSSPNISVETKNVLRKTLLGRGVNL